MQTSIDVYQAIAHPARRRIIETLAEHESSVSALAEPFEMSRPAVSQHLRILRQAGLVSERRSGRERIYQLEPEPLKEVRDWISRYDRFWARRLDSLGDLLDGQARER